MLLSERQKKNALAKQLKPRELRQRRLRVLLPAEPLVLRRPHQQGHHLRQEDRLQYHQQRLMRVELCLRRLLFQMQEGLLSVHPGLRLQRCDPVRRCLERQDPEHPRLLSRQGRVWIHR